MDRRRLALIRSGDADAGRVTVGSGYLIAPRLVLTARHVLVDRHAGTPWPVITVRVGHHLDGEPTRADAELLWAHPGGLDVALLRIDREVDPPGSVRWGRPAGTAPLPYEGLGYPWAAKGKVRAPEHLRGLLPVLSGGRDRYVLDQGPAPAARTDGGNAWAGTSGAAIFCGGHLVGVVTEEDQAYGARRLVALPASSFADDDAFTAHVEEHTGRSPLLGAVGAPLPKAGPAPERTRAERELEQLLTPLFPHPDVRVDHARALARELGYEPHGYEPSTADLAALLTTHPRALASLGEAVASGAQATVRAALTHLFSWARALDRGALLSVNEYHTLIDLLRRVCEKQSALLPRTAGEALRHVVLPEALTRSQLGGDEVQAVVEGLEDLTDGVGGPDSGPPVPALLRLVEYVAAAVGDGLGAELRTWSEKTAQRLGIHPGALGERRTDAARWAKRTASPVSRVVMELAQDPAAGGDRYRVRVLLVRDDGSYRVLKETESEPKTPQEAASTLTDAVHAAAQEPGHGDQVPWVTVVVDRAGLDLAVDEWEAESPDGILPAWPIGADYRLSLSCPELSDRGPQREGDQERRWQNGRDSVLVTDHTCGDARQLVHLLKTEHRDTARVVLHGPADQRRSWLLTCLALGVPVVLWDRAAVDHDDAGKLEPLAPADDLAGLPERLRGFRSDSAASPAERRARPSLVWEPKGRPPRSEPLYLSDPWRGTHAS
ncbi:MULTISPECIES: trypsin-like peptidase domain-containing protein [Streptomyces]|uniref:VMAP-C domain-containing protein n=1 Tax=Streptomyces TaxID=1883 RepID=UPI00136F293B|nr:trypsin-like peptidase domain-containing protein [Streptomyces venezuelae]MYY83745.1 trypsin-like serine protease [Streptomyces sp. SID335]MYZ13774.1 trypsin-like serine protease [Streptomyces sp. SID337]NDZ86142.1 trypsin-like peptidase domain-containing protein [Streptomyces sp. SID10115]NEA05208.1 trypsin-like peptidase domain-containing protein [Streptomyces sp. SID10116]NEB49044.1 trypsin-like peptidase domain-containing protein [Streptomyces sp. SID339]